MPILAKERRSQIKSTILFIFHFLHTCELGNQSRTDDSVAISVRQSLLNRERDVIKEQEDSEDKYDDNLNYGSSAGDRVPKESEGKRENPIAFRLVGA